MKRAALKKILKRLFMAKFGPLQAEVDAHIDAVDSAEDLERYLDQALRGEVAQGDRARRLNLGRNRDSILLFVSPESYGGGGAEGDEELRGLLDGFTEALVGILRQFSLSAVESDSGGRAVKLHAIGWQEQGEVA